MNPEPTDRRDADALDAFWDGLVFDQITGSAPHAATSPNEEMVMNLHSLLTPEDERAERRLRGLVFGTEPAPAMAGGPVRPLPIARPEPMRPSRSIRNYAHLAAAALIVVLVGALVAAQSTGFFGGRGGNDAPTAIPAAFVQPDATPAALASPIAATDGVLWTLPFAGTNVEIGASALADGTLYRLVRSNEFTGVQAVDTATGAERWRSAQAWQGNGLGADENGVYLPTVTGVTALDPQTGDQRWNAVTQIAAWSMAVDNGRAYVWDGSSSLDAIDLSDGSVIWQGVANVDTASTKARASQAPIATENGVAAVSGTGTVALFDTGGNFAGIAGNLKPETVELAATADGMVAIAGALRLETDQSWARKLMLVDPANGSTVWEVDYNALVTGLTVTDTMALVLADNPGLAMSEVQLANPDGSITTEQTNPYPEQTSPNIFGYFLDTGMTFQEPEDPTAWNAHGKTWIADAGNPPFVALAQGPNGPIGISDSGRLTFFGLENPLAQAVMTLPGALPDRIIGDDAAVYVSLADGTLTAVDPAFANIEAQSFSTSNIDWSMPLAGQLVDFGGMAYGNGLVYRLIDAGSGPQIEATYASTGQPAWSLPFTWGTDQIVADGDTTNYSPNQAYTNSGNIFVVDSEHRLIALDGPAGTVAWQHAFTNPVVSMVYDADTLYVWDESGTMTALLPKDGTVLWATTPGDASGPQSNELGMPIPAVTGTTIAMVDANGTLHGFSKELGTLLWSTPGFDGTNTRLVHQGLSEAGQQEWFVVLTAHGEPDANGNFESVVSGVLAQTGERRWDDYVTGPLVQPVATNETMVFLVGNEAMTGKAVTPSDPVVDSESHNYYVWTGSGETAPAGGGQRLFALDVDTGQIVWIRTTAAGGFANLSTKFPNSGSLIAVTTDGFLVSPSRGNGSIDREPAQLGGPVLAVISSGEAGAIGSFAMLEDGTLVAFGGTPFSQQG